MTLRDWLLLGIALAYTAASLTPQADVRQGREGLATWYCGNGSACTAGFGPSDLVAAIDPTTGYEKGERVTVWHGDRSVSVRIVDVCACAGARVIDLSRLAFSRLADPDLGVIPVVLVPERGASNAVPRVTLPPTDTLPDGVK